MRYLIIGAAGFIGTELTGYLLENGNEVIGYDVIPKPEKSVFDNAKVVYKQLGVVDKNDYAQSDCLVLLAAKRPYKDFSFADYTNNVEIVERYCREASANGLKSIVFASSKAVYSGENMPWKESERTAPSSLYGASKLACEDLGMFYSLRGEVFFKSLRFAQIIGLGERKGYLINTLIDNAAEKKTQIIYGSGTQKRHYVYVKDVCRAIYTASFHKEHFGVYNIGMKTAASNLELALCVNKVFDNVGNLRHDYTKEMIGNDDEIDVGYARESLGFSAGYDLESTFKDIAESIKKNDR